MIFLFVPIGKYFAIDTCIWLTQKVNYLKFQVRLNFLEIVPQLDKIFGNMNDDFDHLSNSTRLKSIHIFRDFWYSFLFTKRTISKPEMFSCLFELLVPLWKKSFLLFFLSFWYIALFWSILSTSLVGSSLASVILKSLLISFWVIFDIST